MAILRMRTVSNGESIIRSAGLGPFLATGIIIIRGKIHKGRIMTEVMCVREIQVIVVPNILEFGS